MRSCSVGGMVTKTADSEKEERKKKQEKHTNLENI